MSMDTIADMFAKIQNNNERYLEKVDITASKVKEQIIKIFKEEGYVSSYKRIDDRRQGILRIYLKYGEKKERIIKKIRRISKPGLRIYKKWNEIPKVYNGLGTGIISTSKGVMTFGEAKHRRLGGELVCSVW